MSKLPKLDPTGQALEAALVDDPDDEAAHLAFADWLVEQANPRLQARGEFVRVQLDLADPKRSRGRRKPLQQREKELLATQERHWLGEQLHAILTDPKQQCEREYERGWLSLLRFREFTTAQAKALVNAPCLRLLCHLDLNADSAEAAIGALAGCPYLGNVRKLDLFIWRGAAPLEALVARMGRLEELHLVGKEVDPTAALALPLHHLKELTLNETLRYPLREIAANASLGKIESLVLMAAVLRDGVPAAVGLDGVRALARSPHLRSLLWLTIHRGDMGDEGVREMLASGLVGRLQSLDLSHGCVTDVGARLLAGSRDVAGLYRLELLANRITPKGAAALERLRGVKVLVGTQWEPDGDGLYPTDDMNDSLEDDDWE